MSDEGITPDQPQPEKRLIFDPEERRVLGVLIEKGLTNPKSYPLSMNLLLSGCNQRSNRDPITHLEEVDIEDALDRLQQRGFTAKFYPGEGGRVHRYRQDLGKTFELRGVQMAVIAELLLRGPQSIGELRTRASRMRDIPTLQELQEILDGLEEHSPPFVRRLTPPGVSRGVRYTHTCYSDEEMAEILEAEASGVPTRSSSPSPGRSSAEIDALNDRVAELEKRIARIELVLGQDEATA